MRVALAQINALVGAVAANERRILAAIAVARRQDAQVVVFPEGALTGYPCRDLLYEEALVAEAGRAAQRIARASADLTVILGSVTPGVARGPGGRPLRQNVALLLEGGKLAATRGKSLLPTYDVFDEARWFVPARANAPVTVQGETAGLVICEDLWDEAHERKPARDLVAAGARTLFALNASPFRVGVREERLLRARRPGVPLVYVNAVGGQDELVFDGGSFALDARGEVLVELPSFEEAVVTVDLSAPPTPPRGEGTIAGALTLGIRDFVQKNGLKDVWLGLSGGVDSTLVACLARDALGPARVHALALPSRHNDPRSTGEALALARALGISCDVIPIEPLHAACESVLGPLLSGTAGENAQARLRMLVLMTHVNANGGVLLNTTNKTELALGYGTLHGDLAGTLAPIGDLSKTRVYELARAYPEIPRFILERPPSAELAPGQVDPFDYDLVSPLVDALVDGVPLEEVLARFPEADVRRCQRLLGGSEHKRRVAPIVLKVTGTAFGTGRQVPVTHRFAPDVSLHALPASA